VDLQRIREQEFPLTKAWRSFNHAATAPLSERAATAMESAQIAAQLRAQHFVLAVRDGRLHLWPHFNHTAGEIDAPLEALP
jgi:hypothetical protein